MPPQDAPRGPAPSALPTGVVAYYRVSTGRQGRSGLGLDAQRDAVVRHVAAIGGRLVEEFTEVESGRKSDRSRLAAALAACRGHRALLVIAKLDRLARDAHFLLGLQKAGVEFVAVDMPHANRLTIGIMALVAEEEARATSARTKAALAAAKARGVRLGNPHLRAGSPETARRAAAVRSARATERAAEIGPYIERARRAGASSLRELAQALTALGVRTPTGKRVWGKEQVRQALLRIAAVDQTR